MAAPAQLRAEAELRADPYRSNRLIAQIAGVEHHAVGRARRRLEAAGVIEPTAKRVPRYPLGPRQLGRAQQAVADLGPGCTTRQIMDHDPRVSRESAWYARTHPRTPISDRSESAAPVADVAAATDAISVVRQEAARYPRIEYRRVTDRPTSAFYIPPDASHELWCCTAEAAPGGGWQHERSCVMRLAGRR